MFYIEKTTFKKKEKKISLLETAAFRFGAKEGGWGKRELGARSQTST